MNADEFENYAPSKEDDQNTNSKEIENYIQNIEREEEQDEIDSPNTVQRKLQELTFKLKETDHG